MTLRPPTEAADHLPLKPTLFWVLLVLIDGSLHGYGLLKEIEARTEGAVQLEPGNLYRHLKRLLDDGLIVEVDGADDDSDDRRRYYTVSPLGRDVARAEAERMRRLVHAAEDRRLIGPDEAGA